MRYPVRMTLQRYLSNQDKTFGILTVYFDERTLFTCSTIEPPFNPNTLDASVFKCIPPGNYTARKEFCPHIDERNLYRVQWEHIPPAIHDGYSVRQSFGCILIGESISSSHKLRNPFDTIIKFHSCLQYFGNPEIPIQIH